MKLFTRLIITLLVFPAFSTLALDKSHVTNKTAATKSSFSQNTIKLYTDPTANAKIIANISSTSTLIPIFRQGEWLKVGNASNGQVGWINYQQLQNLREKMTSPSNVNSNVQITLIQAQLENGSPKYHIIAYRNGKKLSDKEAITLYEQMNKQQQTMNNIFQKDMETFNSTFATIANMPIIQPIVIDAQSGNKK